MIDQPMVTPKATAQSIAMKNNSRHVKPKGFCSGATKGRPETLGKQVLVSPANASAGR
jgi:hypothetical protein